MTKNVRNKCRNRERKGSQWDSVAAFEDVKDDMEGECDRYISGDGGDEKWPRGAP
ncbi:hypothetical protein TSUD_04100 [Trifolium subterraneum]|nr:hypothetical protein TSUD_04100 [Trifolium subterraneum]